ncbi:MAG: hypothetical protein NVSMB64_13550 [Candidatus Velthaea sp.]
MARSVASKGKTHAQIAPRALAIIRAVGYDVPDHFREDGSPNFRGLPREFWVKLATDHPDLLDEMGAILRSDFPTYAALLLKVFSKRHGHLIPFIFTNAQVIGWNAMARLKAAGSTMFIVFLKARQLGISTMVAGWQHWNLWRLYDVETTLIGHEVKLVEKFIGMLRVYHEELPDVAGIRPRLRADNATGKIPRKELYYSDRRSWCVTQVAKNVDARGMSAKHILLSELAFYPEPQALLDALLPQLPPFGSPARRECSVIVESTPNGQNFFYDLWQSTKQQGVEWVGIFLPWMVQDDVYAVTPAPGFKLTSHETALRGRLSAERRKIDGKDVSLAQMYWRRHTLDNDYHGDEEAFDMEYPSDDETCFLLRSHSVFKEKLRFLQSSCVEAERRSPAAWGAAGIKTTKGFMRGNLSFPSMTTPFGDAARMRKFMPKFMEAKFGDVTVWEPPIKGHSYVIGCDAAGGIEGRDNSVAHVCDVTMGRQVAEIAGPISPEPFADLCVALAYWYNTALLYPEVNSVGSVVLKRMRRDWQYPNVGREEKWDENQLKKDKYGIYTSPNNKAVIVSNLKWIVDEQFYQIASRALLSEMSTYEQSTDGTYNAKSHKHDDRVIALALALYAVRQSPKMFSALTDNRHGIPNAVELGLSKAPTPEQIRKENSDDVLPKVVSEALGRELQVPFNPIRGYGAFF